MVFSLQEYKLALKSLNEDKFPRLVENEAVTVEFIFCTEIQDKEYHCFNGMIWIVFSTAAFPKFCIRGVEILPSTSSA